MCSEYTVEQEPGGNYNYYAHIKIAFCHQLSVHFGFSAWPEDLDNEILISFNFIKIETTADNHNKKAVSDTMTLQNPSKEQQ